MTISPLAVSRCPLPPHPPVPGKPGNCSAARLGEIRQDAGLTGRALAHSAAGTKSKVSRIEHARTAPSSDDILLWCEHCGVPGEADELVAFLRNVRDMFVEWRRMERTGLKRAQEAVLPLWERTRFFRAYSSWLIPGAVQPADTPRRYSGPSPPGGTARRHRRGRRGQGRPAAPAPRGRPPVLRGVSRNRSCVTSSVAPEVMAGQLGHLISVASLPSSPRGHPDGPHRETSCGRWRTSGSSTTSGERRARVRLADAHPASRDRRLCRGIQPLSDIAVPGGEGPRDHHSRHRRPRLKSPCKLVQVHVPVPRCVGLATGNHIWYAMGGTSWDGQRQVCSRATPARWRSLSSTGGPRTTSLSPAPYSPRRAGTARARTGQSVSRRAAPADPG